MHGKAGTGTDRQTLQGGLRSEKESSGHRHRAHRALTLLQLCGADGARAVPVILLKEVPPLLEEFPQGREANDINAARLGLVKHV